MIKWQINCSNGEWSERIFRQKRMLNIDVSDFHFLLWIFHSGLSKNFFEMLEPTKFAHISEN